MIAKRRTFDDDIFIDIYILHETIRSNDRIVCALLVSDYDALAHMLTATKR